VERVQNKKKNDVQKETSEEQEDVSELVVEPGFKNQARFFHFMIQTFLEDVHCVNKENQLGFYGPTSGFYGTVEQQRSKNIRKSRENDQKGVCHTVPRNVNCDIQVL